MPRQHGIDDLRHHRVVVAHDAREQRFAPPQLADQVLAHLVFDPASAQAFFGKLTASEFSEGPRKIHEDKAPLFSSLDYTPRRNTDFRGRMAENGVGGSR